jgi:hypothetical protein
MRLASAQRGDRTKRSPAVSSPVLPELAEALIILDAGRPSQTGKGPATFTTLANFISRIPAISLRMECR